LEVLIPFLVLIFISCFLSSKVKVSWLPLTPFVKCVIIYFAVWSFDFFDNNLLSTVLKCAPIISLMAFILCTGFMFAREYRYQQRILVGLVFSCIGDAFLDYQNGILFQYGMMSFAVAQLFYISAFGWKPFRVSIGLAIFLSGGFGNFLHSSSVASRV
jgi:YhhN family